MSQNFMGISTESRDEITRVLISRESLRLKKKKRMPLEIKFQEVPNLPTMLTQMLLLIFFNNHVTIIYAINEV